MACAATIRRDRLHAVDTAHSASTGHVALVVELLGLMDREQQREIHKHEGWMACIWRRPVAFQGVATPMSSQPAVRHVCGVLESQCSQFPLIELLTAASQAASIMEILYGG